MPLPEVGKLYEFVGWLRTVPSSEDTFFVNLFEIHRHGEGFEVKVGDPFVFLGYAENLQHFKTLTSNGVVGYVFGIPLDGFNSFFQPCHS